MPFTFTAQGTCGGTLTASLALQAGTQQPGDGHLHFPVGHAHPNHRSLPENSNTRRRARPVLRLDHFRDQRPSRSGSPTNRSTLTRRRTPRVLRGFPPSPAWSSSDSPLVAIHSSSARLAFRNNYLLEAEPDGSAAYPWRCPGNQHRPWRISGHSGRGREFCRRRLQHGHHRQRTAAFR